jgi:poly(3-hydroxyalkanoate) synthetase
MGQCNVKKWVGDILPLVEDTADPLGVLDLTTHTVPITQDPQAYKTFQDKTDGCMFVLGSGGHIAGIVSPPGPKVWYQAADGDEKLPITAAQWREGAARKQGTWWDDWATWSAETSGPMVDPPRVGSEKYPVLGDGPGTYVLG